MMRPEEIDRFLQQTLDDFRVSRGERRTLQQLLDEAGSEPQQLAWLRHRAFELARGELLTPQAVATLEWLEEIVKTLHPPQPATLPEVAVAFSPGEQCWSAIRQRVESARQSADICVFTITDDRISDALLRAHRRGIRMRIISDDDKAGDLGSDIDRLAEEGVQVRIDNSPYHMHHKFAIFDGDWTLTGSYNWTRSAAEHNEENLLVTNDPRVASSFQSAFNSLWDKLSGA